MKMEKWVRCICKNGEDEHACKGTKKLCSL